MRHLPLLCLLVACGPKDAPDPPRPGEPAGGSVGDPAHVDPPDPGEPAGARGDAQIFVDEHNRYRAEHCAPPLAWSTKLAKVAQDWADQLRETGCAFDHSKNPYGENLAMGTSGAMPPETVVEMWYREVDGYDFKRGGFSMDTGHFTQLVWKGTTEIGCGKATCDGWDLWVCNYSPYGNVEGGYQANVLPESCK